jgi:multiple sugar transport system permease protein
MAAPGERVGRGDYGTRRATPRGTGPGMEDARELGSTSGRRFPRRSAVLQRRRNRRLFPFIAVAPAVVLVVAIMFFPIGATIYHSFTAWDGQVSKFIGLTNFRLLAQSSVMRSVFMNSVIFLLSVPAIVLASLVAAVLVYERVLGWRTFRVLFFIPGVLSPVVIGELFSTFVLPNGLANLPLRWLGLHPIGWLTSPWPARFVVMAALIWSSFGFGMIIILSAMSTIDPSLYDAALIDGASWWRRLRSVTLPLVSESLQFLSVINVIYTFTALFSFVFVITSGGPGFSTTTIDYYTYQTTFENGQFGYGSALALVLFIIVLALTIAQFKLMPKQELQQGK